MSNAKHMPGAELIDAIHDHRALCASISRRLLYLAESLSAIGMEKLSDELDGIAEALPASAKSIQDAHGIKLNHDVAHSESVAFGMLQLALHGGLKEPNKAEVQP